MHPRKSHPPAAHCVDDRFRPRPVPVVVENHCRSRHLANHRGEVAHVVESLDLRFEDVATFAHTAVQVVGFAFDLDFGFVADD